MLTLLYRNDHYPHGPEHSMPVLLWLRYCFLTVNIFPNRICSDPTKSKFIFIIHIGKYFVFKIADIIIIMLLI